MNKGLLKDNKGFSLAELLIAMVIFAIIITEVASVMFNSSKLYRNGTYEVNLQTEAQQFITQLEDLLINSDKGSISVNSTDPLGSTYSIDFTISGNSYSVIYTDTTGKPYGSVSLISPDTAGVAVLMADYVSSVSLNTADYSTSDRVYLTVEMSDGKYSYSGYMDLYVRNNDNGDRNTRGKVPTEDGTIELDVLRYKVYDLYEVCGINSTEERDAIEFSFRVDPSASSNNLVNIAGAETPIYSLSGTNNSSLKTTDPINESDDEWGKTDAIYILGIDKNTGNEEYKIRVTTDEVYYGQGGIDVVFATYSNASELVESYSKAQGIWLGAITGLDCTLTLKISSYSASTASFDPRSGLSQVRLDIPGADYCSVQWNGDPKIVISPDQNCFVTTMKNFQMNGSYSLNSIYSTYHGAFYLTLTIKYPLGREDELILYPCITGYMDATNIYLMPDEFWDIFSGINLGAGGLGAI